MEVRKHIPNALTLSNLLLGMMAIVFISRGDFTKGGLLILLGSIPDFLDGMVARLLKVSSAIGKDLDSLADMVTFGVAPSFLLFSLAETKGVGTWSYLALMIAVFAGLRLAKFNNDTRQTDEFIGLPTPSAALLLCSLPFVLEQDGLNQFSWMVHPVTIAVLSIGISLLMVSDIRLFSLKFKNLKFEENIYRFSLILISIALLAIFGYLGISLTIFSYILLSLIRNFAK